MVFWVTVKHHQLANFEVGQVFMEFTPSGSAASNEIQMCSSCPHLMIWTMDKQQMAAGGIFLPDENFEAMLETPSIHPRRLLNSRQKFREFCSFAFVWECWVWAKKTEIMVACLEVTSYYFEGIHYGQGGPKKQKKLCGLSYSQGICRLVLGTPKKIQIYRPINDEWQAISILGHF